MNTIQQQVLAQYRAIVSSGHFSAEAPAKNAAVDANRQELDAPAKPTPPPLKGRYVDVRI